jgi:putative nucleotidyltransferase with HDIG domain
MKKQALQIIEKLNSAGFQAAYAGGSVRDKLLCVESHDIDIATNALPEDIESLFEKTIPVGKAFGVIVVVIDGIEFEVATFRNDGVYLDGRHPENVSFSSMEEDAKRRDFTINGMFYDPIKDEIFDFVGGQEDLKNKVLRFIGDPEKRIQEDKLRMLRCIRFSIRLGFEIESKSFDVICNHASEISQVSVERISEELLKILHIGNHAKAFELLFKTKLIDYILPEVKAMEGIEQPPEYHSEGDVLVHTVIALENLPKDASDELLMGTLLHDVGKPKTQTFEDRIRFSGHDAVGAKITEIILKRMKFSNDFVERVVSLVENHMKFMFVKDMRTSTLKRFIRKDFFDEHLALHKADCMSSHGGLDNYEFVIQKREEIPPEQIRPERLMTGHDLINMGFAQGPLFRTIMTDVEDKQLEGSITSREEALKYVTETYQEKKDA